MVKNYFKAVRILNLALLSFIFWGLMLHIYNSGIAFEINHVYLFWATITTTASGYLINNYHDLQSDKINNKSIIDVDSGYYLKSYFVHLSLSFFFLLISSLSGGWFLLILFLHILVLLYSLKLQHLPLIGNTAVALLCSIVILIPQGISNQYFNFNNYNSNENITIIFSLFCFLITLKREAVKDLEDIKGDQKTGSYTLPIALGKKVTFYYIFILLAVELVFLLNCIKETNYEIRYLFFYSLQLIILIITSYKLYLDKTKNFKIISSLIKLQFVLAGIGLYLLL